MGWSRPDEESRADHYRDLHRHEWRPGDRLDVPICGALEVALIVKGLKSIDDAGKLIEQYAQTVASEARLQAVTETSERILAQIAQFGGAPHA